ncbi:MAG: DegT/DnrJ/EryC1/StrS family aminotransferase, partial [Flavobacteriales bacterium]|nr:DegT/DnrJ/EryC1/StrS family aminotransferase [Flavobacteriales bacterium]
YRQALSQVRGIHCLPPSGQTASNYSYFPILVTEGYPLTRDELYQKLKDNNVFARRYFYPLISEFDMYKEMPSASASNLPIASKATQQVLCLPIYAALGNELQDRIIEIIKSIKL